MATDRGGQDAAQEAIRDPSEDLNNDERWRRAKEIFFAASRAEPVERPPLLDALCGGDAPLRHQIEQLLDAHDEAGDFLAEPAARLNSTLPERDSTMVGQPVGRYRIEAEIGRGGMGAVYRASRDDAEFRQQVALKVLKRGMDTDEIVHRFRTERQILAALDHPHIARLLDGGSTEDGRPYLVMELVEGVAIDAFCTERGVALAGRIDLVRTVCSAVQFAHQKLVIHRDLKPGNILVTADGTVKLLDFGIAKLLDPDLAASRPIPTAPEQAPLTPEFASPEQLEGGPLGTTSDIYSLGALLYRLLAGVGPYRAVGSFASLRRAVLAGDPPPPSSRVAEPLRRKLRGDLDNICLKALARQPEGRYHSAQQLADDLARHQQGLPVVAREATALYRAAKFVRRHKAVSAAAVLLVAFAGAVTWQATEIAQQRDEARRERTRAEQISSLLMEVFEVSDPAAARGREVTARELLAHGTERVREQLEDQPEVKAAVLDTLGRVHFQLGHYEEAMPLLEEALRLRRAAAGPEGSAEVATTAGHLARVLAHSGNEAGAEPLYQESVRLNRRWLGEDDPTVAVGLNDLAVLQRARGDTEKAEALFLDALKIQRASLGPDHANVATTLSNLATLYSARGDYARARDSTRKALEIFRLHRGENHPDVAVLVNNLAILAHHLGDYEAAQARLRDALAIHRRTLGNEHVRVALGARSLAVVLLVQGHYPESRALLDEAIEIAARAVGEEHWVYADLLAARGDLERETGDAVAASSDYQRALELFADQLGADHAKTLDAHNRLGQLLSEQGDPAAEELLQRALSGRRATLPADDPKLAGALQSLGSHYLLQGRLTEAEPLLRSSYALRTELLPSNHLHLAESALSLGVLRVESGQPGAARPLLEQALEIRRAALPTDHWRYAEALGELGYCLARLGERDQARRFLRQALPTLRSRLPESHPTPRRLQEALDGLALPSHKPSAAKLVRRKG